MTTKQIIHNSKGAAEAEQIALYNKIKHKLGSIDFQYNDVVKHPTLSKWATRYLIPSENDSDYLKNLWQIVYDHLNPNQINNLVDVTADWYNNETI